MRCLPPLVWQRALLVAQAAAAAARHTPTARGEPQARRTGQRGQRAVNVSQLLRALAVALVRARAGLR